MANILDCFGIKSSWNGSQICLVLVKMSKPNVSLIFGFFSLSSFVGNKVTMFAGFCDSVPF